MAKVRIKSPQWAGFSSYLGVTEFKDGVSVNDVSKREADLIGSIMAVEFVDDDGKPIGDAGYAQMQVDGKSAEAPVEAKKIMASDKYEHREEIGNEPVTAILKGKEKSEADDAVEDLEQEIEKIEADEASDDQEAEGEKIVWTQEALEEEADENGIVGLRKIGEGLNVRSNSIESLIDKILKAQG